MPISARREPGQRHMRAKLWIGLSSFSLRGGLAAPGVPFTYDDTVYPDDSSRHRRLAGSTSPSPITAQPRDIQVDGAEKLELVLKRESQNACRWDVLVTDYNVRTPVLPGHPVALTLLTHGRGIHSAVRGGRRRRAGRALATLSSAGAYAPATEPPAMSNPIDRRKFLKIAGVSLGFGALYRVAPALARGGERGRRSHGCSRARTATRVTPFSFVQLSDTHVGFSGPPNPTGTRAFERAVEIVNRLPQTPDLVLFTGDLTHDSEDRAPARGAHAPVPEDREPAQGAGAEDGSRRTRRRARRRRAVPRALRRLVVLVRPPRRALRGARQRLAPVARGGGRADRVAQEGPGARTRPRRPSSSSPTGRCSISSRSGSGSPGTGTR